MVNFIFLVAVLTLPGVGSESAKFSQRFCCRRKELITGGTNPLNCVRRCLEQYDTCKEVQWNDLKSECYRNTGRCFAASIGNSRCLAMRTQSFIAQDILCMVMVTEAALPKGTPLKGFTNEWECKLFCNLWIICKAYRWSKGLCSIHDSLLKGKKHKIGNDSSVGIKNPNCKNEQRCLNMMIGVHSLKGTVAKSVSSLLQCMALLESEQTEKVDWHIQFEDCFSHPINHPIISIDDRNLIQIQKRQYCNTSKHRTCVSQTIGLTFEDGMNMGVNFNERDCVCICKSVSNCYAVGWQRTKGSCLIYLQHVPLIQNKKLPADFNFYMIIPCGKTALSSNKVIVISREGVKLCQFKCIARTGCLAVTYVLKSLTCYLVFDKGYLLNAEERILYPRASKFCEIDACKDGSVCITRRKGTSVCLEDPRRVKKT